MGAFPWGDVAASGSAVNGPQFQPQFPHFLALLLAGIVHDRPRSWPDRASIGRRSHCRSSRKSLLALVELIPQPVLHDRGSIAPRSRLDRATIAEFFHVFSRPSDETSTVWTARSRSTRCSHRTRSQPSDARLMIA